jgi:AraC family transcriptional regulator, transcriptional activator of pobA
MDNNRTFYMIKDRDISNFEGLYGDITGKYSSEYIFLELISTRSQTFDWNIKPHIHSQLYQAFVVEKGSLQFQDANQKHLLEAPCILLIPPTKLHGLVYSPEVEGYILTLSDTIMEDIFKTSDSIWKTFEDVRIMNYFEEIAFEKIQNSLVNLEFELFSENPERFLMLRAYLIEFFIHLHRLTKLEETDLNDSQKMTHFRKFQQLIKQVENSKSIPQLADELSISPVHLNRICQAMVGKTAKELVQQNTIAEAKKYLLHTSYSVSEIAYLLKFEYPNYFAKLFKKHTGLSPVEFRRLDRN